MGRTLLHHDLQELDDHLAAGAYKDLPLSALLCIVHGFQGIAQHAYTHHLGGSACRATDTSLQLIERIDSESRQSSRAVAQGYYWLLLTGGSLIDPVMIGKYWMKSKFDFQTQGPEDVGIKR